MAAAELVFRRRFLKNRPTLPDYSSPGMAARFVNINEVVTRPAVQKVCQQVRELTALPVTFRHTSEWRPTEAGHPVALPGPAMHPTESSYDVYLNDVLPEQMAVHELLHIVLINEGYPDIHFHASQVTSTDPDQWQFASYADGLVNKLQHPEIYRRMADEYDQDMQPYQSLVSTALGNAYPIDLRQGPLSFSLGKQTAIVDLIDLLYLQPGSLDTLDRFRGVSADTYITACDLKEAMDQVGFQTPTTALRCMEFFIEHIVQFGEMLEVGADSELWRALEWFLPEP